MTGKVYGEVEKKEYKGNIIFYCSDNVKTLKETYSDAYFDLVITSPPYDDMKDYHGYKFDFILLADELYRVLKPGGVIVWIVSDQTKDGTESGTSFEQVSYFKSLGLLLHDTMIYLKSGFSTPSSNRYHQLFEYMFILSKGKPKTFNPIKDKLNAGYSKGWTVGASIRKKNGKMSVNNNRVTIKEYGMRSNIWKYKTGRGNGSTDSITFNHPASFPDDLARDHIYTWSNPGEVILDPMFGSGTVLKMAYLMKRTAHGIDCSTEYYELMGKRLNEYSDVDIPLIEWDAILNPGEVEDHREANPND